MATYSTEQLADLFKVKAATIRTKCSMHGHYLGMVPVKLTNRRLAWSIEAAHKLISSQ